MYSYKDLLDLQYLHHNSIFGGGVCLLQAAASDRGDGGIYGFPGAEGSVVKDFEFEDLEDGGESQPGGGGGDFLALDDIKKRQDVHRGVEVAPFLLGIEDEGSQGF